MNALIIGCSRHCMAGARGVPAAVVHGNMATANSLNMNIQVASFSKYISKSRTKRLPLTTKRVGKGFYKGNGARKEGTISSRARFTYVPEMMTELVIPADFKNFKLKPYVGPGAKRHVIEKHVNLNVNPF